MKKNYLFLWENTKLGKGILSFCLCAFLIGVTSCEQGFDDNERFSGGVTGVTLESPKEGDMKVEPSADGSTVQISWPVVMGAGGYEFSFYIVDDPDNPIAVGEENEIVDGCLVTRELLEDTKYQIVIKTLGNEVNNNKEAANATVKNYSTLVDAIKIPANTDLTNYFNDATLNDGDVFELEANAEYTTSGDINFGNTAITLRGDKIHQPKVLMEGSFVSTGAGMTLKFIEFNMVEGSTKQFVRYGEPDPSYTKTGNVFVLEGRKLSIQSCRVYGLGAQFIYDGGKAYGFETVLVKDSRIYLASGKNKQRMVDFQKSLAVNLKIENSTFADPSFTNNGYFFQTGNNRPDKAGYATCSVSFLNNTFYGISKSNNMFNYGNCYSQKSCTITFTSNLFYNTGNKDTYGKANGGSSTVRAHRNNAYFWTDNTIETGDPNAIKVDPAFSPVVYSTTPYSEWTFVPTASSIVSNQCGDLYWYNN